MCLHTTFSFFFYLASCIYTYTHISYEHSTMERWFRDWNRERKHKAEFKKCKKSLIDLLVEYGRIEKDAREKYKTEGKNEGKKESQLTSFINEELEKNNQLNEKSYLIRKIGEKLKCGQQNQKLNPCVDDENAQNKCSDEQTYKGLARRLAKTWTVSFLQDEIKRLEDDTRRSEDDEELLEKYRERLETVEAASQQKPRSRNSWVTEPAASTLKF